MWYTYNPPPKKNPEPSTTISGRCVAVDTCRRTYDSVPLFGSPQRQRELNRARIHQLYPCTLSTFPVEGNWSGVPENTPPFSKEYWPILFSHGSSQVEKFLLRIKPTTLWKAEVKTIMQVVNNQFATEAPMNLRGERTPNYMHFWWKHHRCYA